MLITDSCRVRVYSTCSNHFLQPNVITPKPTLVLLRPKTRQLGIAREFLPANKSHEYDWDNQEFNHERFEERQKTEKRAG